MTTSLRRGGLSTRIHATVDALGNLTGFTLTSGQASDLVGTDELLCKLKQLRAIATPSDTTRGNFLVAIYAAVSAILLNWRHALVITVGDARARRSGWPWLLFLTLCLYKTSPVQNGLFPYRLMGRPSST